MNVRIPEAEITGGSLVVLWDAVTDYFNVTYTVRYRGDHGGFGFYVVFSGLSQTITRLRNNTSYNVSVAAINTCCGTGPYSDIITVMTNTRPTTPPPTSPTLSTPTTPPGNVYHCIHN